MADAARIGGGLIAASRRRGCSGSNREGVQGAHLNPLGLFLEPPGPLLTHLHTVYMGYSERLPTRLNLLAERTCFSQVNSHMANAVNADPMCTRRGGGCLGPPPCLGETGPLSQGGQARRKALRIRHINGMEVRKKRPRGFKKRPRGFK